jgi:hypothetical protein
MTYGALVRFVFLVAAAATTMLFTPSPARADVSVTINGNPVNIYPAPIMQTGRVFVPLRSVFQSLGASVVYNSGQINATGSNNTTIALTIGSTQAQVNGSPVTIDVAPFIVGASTYVPLRFVSQALGANVSWDDANQIVNITYAGAGSSQPQNSGNWVNQPPPPIPAYQPPLVPAPNYLWTPGYWAWGIAGFFWVPGTYVLAPQPGLLWTPGYWGWQNGYYGWNPGYWSRSVGFYGGINYGGGYYGQNYYGGRWSNNIFSYNTAVTPVNTAVIRNVYVDKTVIVNNTTVNRISYNGGPGGLTAAPTASERAVAQGSRVAITAAQRAHVQAAEQNRALLATVNAGRPPLVVVQHPLTAQTRPPGFVPITAQDRAAAQKLIVNRPVVQPVPALPRPTIRPTPRPTLRPTSQPPVIRPTLRPTPRPTPAATLRPTPRPTLRPTPRPTLRPTPERTAPEKPPSRPKPTPTPTP